jgi:hypothetical protein
MRGDFPYILTILLLKSKQILQSQKHSYYSRSEYAL